MINYIHRLPEKKRKAAQISKSCTKCSEVVKMIRPGTKRDEAKPNLIEKIKVHMFDAAILGMTFYIFFFFFQNFLNLFSLFTTWN